MAIRIAVGQFNELTDEKLRFAAQVGATGVQMNTPALPGTVKWEYEDLKQLVDQTAAYGLTFEAIENVPIHFYDKAMLGTEGRDEQIANYQAIIRNLGKAGIPVLGYHWMPNSVWRTSRTTIGRGGVKVTAFDLAAVNTGSVDDQRKLVAKDDERVDSVAVYDEDRVSADDLWENYTYFMNAVLPVAEEAGVKLALHPDDPPIAMLGGVARIFSSVEGFKRGEKISNNSPAWGLDLCLGCCSEMAGGAINVFDMIDHFGPADKIRYIHFRDVQGTVPEFQECFIGEGNYNPAEVILRLKRVGFDGFLLDDHVPHMDDDTPWAHRGRAYAIGYTQGLLRMADALA